MKKFMTIGRTLVTCIFLFLASLSNSQEVRSLKSAEELDSLFTSLNDKTVLVNIWATWCAPCVKEFPELLKLYSNYKESGFELVFISVDDKDDKESKLPGFLKKQGVDFVTYYNEFKKPEEIIDYFDKSWGGEIPATYIYNREGKMVKKLIGSHSYEKFEKELKDAL